MNYADWKLFIDAAELGSLSKVALAYGTSQPHVSRQLGALERECGGRLFQRTGRGVVPTELGQRIAPRVRAWMASTEQLVNEVRTTAGTPIGTVRIGVLPSMANLLVTALHYRLRKRFPHVRLAVREGQGAQIETWLEDGSVDLAILYRSETTPRGGDTYLVAAPTYLVGAAGDRITARRTVPFRSIHKLPLVLFCRPSSWRNRLEQLAGEHGITLDVVLEADSLGMQTQVVADGGVYALLGPYAIAAAPREHRLQAAKIADPPIDRHIALAMSRHGELTLACRTVMDLAREVARSGSSRPPVAKRA